MPFANYGPGVLFLLIVGLLFYFTLRLFRKRIKYPFCPNEILSKEKKNSIIVIYQIFSPLILMGFVYTQIRKIKYINDLFAKNELFIPLTLLILLIIFVIMLAFLIESIIRNNNSGYYNWAKKKK